MDQNPKQQVAEKLRTSNNVLITVSKHPSVDQLAAAIGLTLMLNKLGKHTATVFSGSLPDILKFLEPEKTFDNNVDSLRDFIISLSKDKADKLRYKVEDDVVKIFITPYKTKIDESDLEFSQGDFNVDAVMALGVRKRADLDEAIVSHGRILHDATVISVNAGQGGGDVASIDWTDPDASSLSEMLVSISEALEGGILDASMSTAFLTGIVSVTDRFSNEKTTPRLMTMSAQLMAAGANQQLIAKELHIKEEIHKESGESEKSSKDKKQDAKKKVEEEVEEATKQIKSSISDDVKLDDLEKQLQEVTETGKLKLDAIDNEPDQPSKDNEEAELDFIEEPVPKQPKDETVAVIDHEEDKSSEQANAQNNQTPDEPQKKSRGMGPKTNLPLDPSLGGTFNATSSQAARDSQDQFRDGVNDEILTHKNRSSAEPSQIMPDDYKPDRQNIGLQQQPFDRVANSAPRAPINSGGSQPQPMQNFNPPQGFGAPLPHPPEPEEDPVERARREVENAVSGAPFNPANNPVQSLNAQPMNQEQSDEVVGHIQPPPTTIMPENGNPSQVAPAGAPPMPPPMPSQPMMPPPQQGSSQSQAMFNPQPPASSAPQNFAIPQAPGQPFPPGVAGAPPNSPPAMNGAPPPPPPPAGNFPPPPQ